MKTPVNKPPKSKIVAVIRQDKNKRFLLKQSIKGKWKFFTVEHNKDRISRQMANMQSIAEQIAFRQKLDHSGTVESFLLSTSSYLNTAGNGTNKKFARRGS